MPASVPTRREALLVVLLSLIALLTVGAELTARLGLLGIVVSEAVLVLGPAWLWLGFREVPARALGLSREAQRVRTLLGGALAGLGAFWLMSLFESGVLERILPMPPAVKEEMKRLVLPPGGARPIAADLLALALAPAICEEALFRGGVYAAFSGGDRRARALAVVVAAVTFGAFHVSLYRLIPATLLGLLLGLVRVTSGSLLPAIAFHFANNAAVIAMIRLGYDEPPPLASRAGQLGAALAAIALLLGLALTVKRSQPA